MLSPEEFIEDLVIERGFTPKTARNRLTYINMFLRGLPRPLEECSTREIKVTLHQLREKYKSNTFSMLLYISLKYMKAAGIDITNIHIKSPGRENTKTPADMLTAEEVQKIIDSTTNST